MNDYKLDVIDTSVRMDWDMSQTMNH